MQPVTQANSASYPHLDEKPVPGQWQCSLAGKESVGQAGHASKTVYPPAGSTAHDSERRTHASTYTLLCWLRPPLSLP